MTTTIEPGATRVAAVSMRNIDVAFGGVHAVRDVSIDLYSGEVVALLGHNGAGKSTLVSILAGATIRDSGTILINGAEAQIDSPRTARDAGIETIFQNLALADNLDAPSNLFLGREMRTFGFFRKKKAMAAAAAEVLQRINPRFKNLDDQVRNLSGGQRQSIAIARAVYFNARVIIFDEPTAALGPAESKLFQELVTRLKSEGVAILIISHDIHEVFELADKLVVMTDGKVVGRLNTAEATKQQVLSMIILGGSDDGDSDAAKSLVESLL
ncbi:ATP-binding cassette domain-containing protein [Subtercola frigoramans]|uniref:D-xylose transport system ATP-binding protein n=1 Tax=Subtercola frigoramans TaxID=120298 RepID=A0ABS2L0A5_9MICO|nr:ATP-binding cassette domain-containing protein [Subtercola frigoramans]MBM7470484.1 D-xylose transport system ATP-binding protein [Subtercola frigoramans]